MPSLTSTVARLGACYGLISTVVAEKPNVPLFASSRWIVDSDDARVKFRCINWAGHMEPNTPEGLNKKPVGDIADWVKEAGFNCVRLTFSVDHALNPDTLVEDGFRDGAAEAGVDEGELMEMYDQAVEQNPFLANATQRDVYERVISELWDRDIMTILDNHNSRASWCCNLDDGNGWPKDSRIYSEKNSRYFDTDEWLDGLQAVAEWSTTTPGVVGIGIRNEMRAHVLQIPFAAGEWYGYVTRAAERVHGGNEDALVIIGGTNGGADLSHMRTRALDTSGWAGKNVWESHDYSFTVTTPDLGSCDARKVNYGLLYGFVLEQDKDQTGPLWMSEFGVNMNGGDNSGLNDEDYAYLTCFVDWVEGNDADWAHWALQGSYYVREGNVDHDETWGALDKDWNDWRNSEFKGLLGRMFEVTQGP